MDGYGLDETMKDLEHIYTIGDPNSNYDFSDVLIVRSLDGKLWAAHDSGCSCPIPFENHRWPTDFVEVNTADDLRSFIKGQDTDYLDRDIDAALQAAGL